MKPTLSLPLFTILSVLSIVRAQGRAPHGLVYESPLALSPQAYDFFHPNAQSPSGRTALGHDSHAPLPLASTVQSDVAHASVSTAKGEHATSLEAGGIAVIVLGATLAIISAIGVYFVVTTRRNNLNRAKSVQPPPEQKV